MDQENYLFLCFFSFFFFLVSSPPAFFPSKIQAEHTSNYKMIKIQANGGRMGGK